MKSNDRRLHWAYRLLLLAVVSSCLSFAGAHAAAATSAPGVAVLLVDTDRVMGNVEEAIYGQFLEHINHSVVDGLFAEQIQGRGFEGQDFETYWTPFGENGSAATADVKFENGEKSVRLQADHGTAGIRQGRISILQGQRYNGSVWIKPEAGALQLTFRVVDSGGHEVAAVPLGTIGSEWQEVGYSFSSPSTDAQARVEIVAAGTGAVLLDYISMMRADVRTNGMLRPDLLEAIRDLKPPFIRWPGGSFASEYLWKDGIGPVAARKYHPNRVWGGYSDYYSFGTDEFMELCRQLKAEPLIVLSATNTDPAQIQYAMDWVHYLNDPPTTEWGRRRAANGHAAPYDVRYFQIDNEPMNFELSPDRYAEIVNAYGSQLRKIAPQREDRGLRTEAVERHELEPEARRPRRSTTSTSSAAHNYEYENDNFETGIRRIQDYLVKLRDYIRASRHPQIKIAVLEWNLCRTYDWRAGLHAAGSLITYEKLSPDLAMTCPALLMRNTTDNPEWRAWIYHDHVSWFPGSGYVVEKLFREHYAEKYLASATGTFRDIADRGAFFDDVSQMKPEAWRPGALDAIATHSADGRRIVIKAVNYEAQANTLLVRLQGSAVPEKATVKVYTLTAGLTDAPSMEQPRKIHPVETTVPYARTLTIEMKPHSVAVIEIVAD